MPKKERIAELKSRLQVLNHANDRICQIIDDLDGLDDDGDIYDAAQSLYDITYSRICDIETAIDELQGGNFL